MNDETLADFIESKSMEWQADYIADGPRLGGHADFLANAILASDLLVEHDRAVAEKAWDEGNVEPLNGLPRCPECDAPVSMHHPHDWRHDRPLFCNSTRDAVWTEHNPYRVRESVSTQKDADA